MASRQPRTTLELAFGHVVREHRTRLGISQEELGFRSDLHRTYISMLERGERMPSLGTILKLAEGLEIRASRLVAALEDRLP